MDFRDTAHLSASPFCVYDLPITAEEYVHTCVPKVGEELQKYTENFESFS